MASCTCENWTLKDLSSALKSMNKDNKEIVVPMFQRGKRWKQNQEDEFIDSLKKSYPVGTMLFYRSVEGQREIYTLVDGLQRGNTIKKYMTRPTDFFLKDSIPIEVIDSIYGILGLLGQENQIKDGIINIIEKAIQALESLSGVQYYPIAQEIVYTYPTTNNQAIQEIILRLEPFLKSVQDSFDTIANTVIPVIVYTGGEDSLPEIFKRINSKGTALNQYEIYAASWPVYKIFKVHNSSVVEKVLKKYDSLADNEFIVSGYNRDGMRLNKELNSFEYVFGLSRYLNDKYDFLHFDNNSKADEINPMGFELVNACINEANDKIRTLYSDILYIDINLFESRLIEVIEFVGNVIAKVSLFKGNSRKNKIILHSKYQILSMISTTFKEKYEISDLSKSRKTWAISKPLLEKNMIQHYVNDILRNEWNDGGTSKIHKVAKPNKYLTEIPRKVWESTLNAYFEQNNMRQESKKVAGPKKEDLVILNCIYLPLFTALDQLSIESFDVEHIATKDSMMTLISKTKSGGLPISSIANLCYLPEKVNRSKRDKTFYQDINYRKYIDLQEIEQKYSFTQESDLEWIGLSYNTADSAVLREYYMAFLLKRFKKQKEMFYASMKIEDGDDIEEYECPNLEKEGIYYTRKKEVNGNVEREANSNFHENCAERISSSLGVQLEKQSRSVYVSEDGKTGVAVSVSKKYMQGNREKYWFAYRTSYVEKMDGCKNQYLAYACGSEEHILLIPVTEMESTKHKLSHTEKDGRIHWHVVFFKDDSNEYKWLQSLPQLEEVNITRYKI